MSKYAFKTDAKSKKFCDDIVEEMVKAFSISEDEAIGRMNRLWKNIEIIGDDDPVYHEDEEYWARTIYYGKDSDWWLNPPGLKPQPYP